MSVEEKKRSHIRPKEEEKLQAHQGGVKQIHPGVFVNRCDGNRAGGIDHVWLRDHMSHSRCSWKKISGPVVLRSKRKGGVPVQKLAKHLAILQEHSDHSVLVAHNLHCTMQGLTPPGEVGSAAERCVLR
ncbi:hypothetical protein EYF80_000893 [Liparis tanakae]|uniref:Uncharacterized protein n=1 Tax=Liparis tanakae TaxID=230148 RepID=A0A4Z2JFH9_9TELE|nr:hypothetical protein EYF80_000893 [Liparis tanakae]